MEKMQKNPEVRPSFVERKSAGIMHKYIDEIDLETTLDRDLSVLD